jgi:hypothetical protein
MARGANRGFRRHLVGHHANRQQDTDCAGQTEFIPNAVELDHYGEPLCSWIPESHRLPEFALAKPKPTLNRVRDKVPVAAMVLVNLSGRGITSRSATGWELSLRYAPCQMKKPGLFWRPGFRIVISL